jgi:hypothetical protein
VEALEQLLGIPRVDAEQRTAGCRRFGRSDRHSNRTSAVHAPGRIFQYTVNGSHEDCSVTPAPVGTTNNLVYLEFEMLDREPDEEFVEAVAEEMTRLIQHYHPKLVEEMGSE